MTSIPECFSESYAEARPKFCGAAAAAGGAIRSWFNPKARGPNGELLYLDTARFGAADAPNMLVLLIHAINPYGFAWSRRVTEDNVDLNRNFVDHDKAYPKNDGYLALADAILPRQWNEASLAETTRVFDAYTQKHGAYGLDR